MKKTLIIAELLAFCVLLLLVLPSCKKRRSLSGPDWPELQPPDLSDCTRIVVHFPHGALGYFTPVSASKEILSILDKTYIQSFDTYEVEDQGRIKAFAKDIGMGTYYGSLPPGSVPFHARPVCVSCYRNKEQLISFTVYGEMIITDDNRVFKYPRGLPNIRIIEPPEMHPFKLRYNCALNMDRLYAAGPLYRKKVSSYPESSVWCDVIMRDRENTSYFSEERMKEAFKCPCMSEGKCHYAMNPNCEPNSPGDMVLLFETKAGWNQHGGPELFTFDNHEPKGGCVLLNDGTIKFVRTEEELNALKWK